MIKHSVLLQEQSSQINPTTNKSGNDPKIKETESARKIK